MSHERIGTRPHERLYEKEFNQTDFNVLKTCRFYNKKDLIILNMLYSIYNILHIHYLQILQAALDFTAHGS